MRETRSRGKVLTKNILCTLAVAGFMYVNPAIADADIVPSEGGATVSKKGNVYSAYPGYVFANTGEGGNVALGIYDQFKLNRHEIANMYFNMKNGSLTADSLVNYVNSHIDIAGTVNAVRNNKIGGDLFFLSADGMAVTGTGVINAGSLTMITPTDASMVKDATSEETLDSDFIKKWGSVRNKGIPLNPQGTITIQGRINTTNGINLQAAHINVSQDPTVTIAPLLRSGVLDFGDMVNIKREDGTVIDSGLNVKNLTAALDPKKKGDIVLKAEAHITNAQDKDFTLLGMESAHVTKADIKISKEANIITHGDVTMTAEASTGKSPDSLWDEMFSSGGNGNNKIDYAGTMGKTVADITIDGNVEANSITAHADAGNYFAKGSAANLKSTTTNTIMTMTGLTSNSTDVAVAENIANVTIGETAKLKATGGDIDLAANAELETVAGNGSDNLEFAKRMAKTDLAKKGRKAVSDYVDKWSLKDPNAKSEPGAGNFAPNVAATYVHAVNKANVIVKGSMEAAGDAKVKATANLEVEASTKVKSQGKTAASKQQTNKFFNGGVNYIDAENTAVVDMSGQGKNIKGDLTVLANAESNVKSTVKVEGAETSMANGAVNITNSGNTADVNLGGNIQANKMDVDAKTNAKYTVNAEAKSGYTEDEVKKAKEEKDSGTQVGNNGAIQYQVGLLAPKGIESWGTAFTGSGSVAVVDAKNDAKVTIAKDANLQATTDLNIHANSTVQDASLKSNTTSNNYNPKASQKVMVNGAVLYSDISNNSSVVVEDGTASQHAQIRGGKVDIGSTGEFDYTRYKAYEKLAGIYKTLKKAYHTDAKVLKAISKLEASKLGANGESEGQGTLEQRIQYYKDLEDLKTTLNSSVLADNQAVANELNLYDGWSGIKDAFKEQLAKVKSLADPTTYANFIAASRTSGDNGGQGKASAAKVVGSGSVNLNTVTNTSKVIVGSNANIKSEDTLNIKSDVKQTDVTMTGRGEFAHVVIENNAGGDVAAGGNVNKSIRNMNSEVRIKDNVNLSSKQTDLKAKTDVLHVATTFGGGQANTTGVTGMYSKVGGGADSKVLVDSSITSQGKLHIEADNKANVVNAIVDWTDAGKTAVGASVGIVDYNAHSEGAVRKLDPKSTNKQGYISGDKVSIAATNKLIVNNATAAGVSSGGNKNQGQPQGFLSSLPVNLAGAGSYASNRGDISAKTAIEDADVYITNQGTGDKQVTLTAKDTSYIGAYSGSLALEKQGGSAKGFTASLGGAVAHNDITKNVDARIKNTTISGASRVTNEAVSTGQTVAAAGSLGTGTGEVTMGVSGAINDVTANTNAIMEGVNITGGSRGAGTDVINKARSETSVKTIAGAGAVSSSKKGLDAAASYVRNRITNNVTAEADKGTSIQGGQVTVEAENKNNYSNTAGTLAASTGTITLGGAVADNEYTENTKAGIGNNSNVKANNLTVKAHTDSKVTNYVIGASGAAYGKGIFAGAGSYSKNKFTGDTKAFVENSTVVTRDITSVTADSHEAMNNRNGALGVNLGEGIVGTGLSYAENLVEGNSSAYVYNSKINAGGLNVKAKGQHDISNIIVTGGIAASTKVGVGVAGTMDINTVTGNTQALIKNSNVEAGQQDVNVVAEDHTDIAGTSVNAAVGVGSNGGAAVSLSKDKNVNTRVTSARIMGQEDRTGSRRNTVDGNKVNVQAKGDTTLATSVTGVGLAGGATGSGALSGGMSSVEVAGQTEAKVTNINSKNNGFNVTADNVNNINMHGNSFAGNASQFGGSVGAGYNTLKDTSATEVLVKNTDVTHREAGAQDTIKATNETTLHSQVGAAGVGLSLGGGAGVGVGLNDINNLVKTSVIDSAIGTGFVPADSITVSGTNTITTNFTNLAGGGGVVAGGVGVSVNNIDNTVVTTVQGSQLNAKRISVNAKEKRDINQNVLAGALGGLGVTVNVVSTNIGNKANDVYKQGTKGKTDISKYLDKAKEDMDYTPTTGAGEGIKVDVSNSSLNAKNSVTITTDETTGGNMTIGQGGANGINSNIAKGKLTIEHKNNINITDHSKIAAPVIDVQANIDGTVHQDITQIAALGGGFNYAYGEVKNTGNATINIIGSKLEGKGGKDAGIKIIALDQSTGEVNTRSHNYGVGGGAIVSSEVINETNLEVNAGKATIISEGNVDITADKRNSLKAKTLSGNAGAINGVGAEAKAVDTGSANVNIKRRNDIRAKEQGGSVNITAKNNPSVTAEANSAVAGLAAAGGVNRSHAESVGKAAITMGRDNALTGDNVNLKAQVGGKVDSYAEGNPGGAVEYVKNVAETKNRMAAKVNLTENKYNANNLEINAENTTTNKATVQGISVGIVSIANNQAISDTDVTTEVTAGGARPGSRLGNVKIKAGTDTNVTNHSGAGGGGVVDINKYASVSDNTLKTHTNVNVTGDWDTTGHMDVTAINKDNIKSDADSLRIAASTFGGATLKNRVEHNATVNVIGNVTTKGSQSYTAHNATNERGDLAGVGAGIVGGNSNNDLHNDGVLKAQVNIDNAKLTTTGEGGNINATASSENKSSFSNDANSGGLIDKSRVESNQHITSDNRVNVTGKSVLKTGSTTGDVNLTTKDDTDLYVHDTAYAKAGFGIATGDSNIRMNRINKITIGKDATVESANDVNMKAGKDSKLKVNIDSYGENKSLASHTSMTVDSTRNQTNQVNVEGKVHSGRDTNVAAVTGEEDVKYRAYESSVWKDSAGDVRNRINNDNGVNVTGEVVAGTRGGLDLNISGKAQKDKDGKVDYSNIKVTKGEGQEWFDPKSVLVGEKEKGTAELPDIHVSGGNINIETDENKLSGTGTLSAKDASHVNIDNRSNVGLKVKDVVIDREGGKVNYNGRNLTARDHAPFQGTVQNSENGKPVINITTQLGAGSQEGDWKGHTDITGTVDNKFGAVNIANRQSDINVLKDAEIHGQNVTIHADKGDVNQYGKVENDQGGTTGILAGGNVNVDTEKINVSGLIQSGYSKYAAKLTYKDVAAIEKLDKEHGEQGPVLKDADVLGNEDYRISGGHAIWNKATNHWDYAVAVYYNPSTKSVVTEAIEPVGGNKVALRGDVTGTSQGRILAMDGLADINIETGAGQRNLSVNSITNKNIVGEIVVHDAQGRETGRNISKGFLERGSDKINIENNKMITVHGQVGNVAAEQGASKGTTNVRSRYGAVHATDQGLLKSDNLTVNAATHVTIRQAALGKEAKVDVNSMVGNVDIESTKGNVRLVSGSKGRTGAGGGYNLRAEGDIKTDKDYTIRGKKINLESKQGEIDAKVETNVVNGRWVQGVDAKAKGKVDLRGEEGELTVGKAASERGKVILSVEKDGGIVTKEVTAGESIIERVSKGNITNQGKVEAGSVVTIAAMEGNITNKDVKAGFNADIRTGHGSITNETVNAQRNVAIRNIKGNIRNRDIKASEGVNITSGAGDITNDNISAGLDVNVSTRKGNVHNQDVSSGNLVKVRAGTGDVQNKNVEAGGDATVTTIKGTVTTQDVKAGGDVKVATDTGDVKTKDVTAGKDASITTGTGDVQTKDVTAGKDVEVSTKRGDVTVQDVKAGKDVAVTTEKGDITLHSANARDNLRIDAEEGNIEADSLNGNNVKVRAANQDANINAQHVTAGGSLKVEGNHIVMQDIKQRKENTDQWVVDFRNPDMAKPIDTAELHFTETNKGVNLKQFWAKDARVSVDQGDLFIDKLAIVHKGVFNNHGMTSSVYGTAPIWDKSDTIYWHDGTRFNPLKNLSGWYDTNYSGKSENWMHLRFAGGNRQYTNGVLMYRRSPYKVYNQRFSAVDIYGRILSGKASSTQEELEKSKRGVTNDNKGQ